MKKLFIIMLCVSSWLSTIAQNSDNKWSVEGQLGTNEYNGDLENQIFKLGSNMHLYGGVGINRYLNKSFDLGLTTTYGKWAGALNSQYVSYKDKFSGQLFDASLLLKMKLNNDLILNNNAGIAPYLVAGLGYGYYSKFDEGGYKGGNAIIPVGLGVKINLTKKVALQYQFLYNFTFSDRRDYTINDITKKAHQDGKYDNFVKQSIGIVFSFGKPKDTDKDGVIDKLDQCPNTPFNVKVDTKGCPTDSDGDGVADYLDQCANTPSNAKVDATGCPIDSDKDGVADYLDKCPNTPLGVKVNANGCPIDTDQDGVADYLDKCPDTPKGEKVDANGCLIDSDGDGVPDYLDKCPQLKGSKENKGCPEVKKEEKEIFNKALQGIQFESGKDVIRKTSFDILDKVVTILKTNPHYNLIINGHTDNMGKPATNLILSQKRADAVKKYFMDKGINANKLKTMGYGDTQPVADNKKPAGRTLNRRVEFIVEF